MGGAPQAGASKTDPRSAAETSDPSTLNPPPKPKQKQELQALIQYVQQNKAADSDWFTIAPEPGSTNGLAWAGKCWFVHNFLKHEFSFRFDVPATYPAAPPEIEIPELLGKTAKMYKPRGNICTTIHFTPLWRRNAPHFGFAHALCLGLAPWLAAEVPFLVDSGAIVAKN